MVVAALEVALTVHMANMNIPILEVNVLIVGHHHSVAVRIAHLANINMNQDKANVATVDLVHMEVVRIVQLESMNIKKNG